MSQTLVKLSQWEALLLEGLRALGWPHEELLRRVAERDLPKDESIYELDYQVLADFAAAEPETFRSAVESGYSIKYNTVRGIHSWISIAFGKKPELILEEGNEAVVSDLTPSEKERLAEILSIGWKVTEDAAGVYRIQPANRAV
ncbi:hypothetical protein [Paenibacillus gansuensis]|uniref:Uncharacterized protein n=1 Tax=Paenibacillus gansuensis TaxID=306542 RepID=A0ABW5PH12_9BACL